MPVTTDFRCLLSELLNRRMSNNRLGTAPQAAGYLALGTVQGSDMTPQYAGAVVAPIAATLSAACLPDILQPAYGESVGRASGADMRETQDWQRRGKVDRPLIRRARCQSSPARSRITVGFHSVGGDRA